LKINPVINKKTGEIIISLALVKDEKEFINRLTGKAYLTFQQYDMATTVRFFRKYKQNRSYYFKNYSTDRFPVWHIKNTVIIPSDFNVPAESKIYHIAGNDKQGRFIQRGKLFCMRRIEMDGRYISDARTSEDSGRVHIEFTLDKKGAAVFSRVTEKLIGKKMGILIDGIVLSYPTIQSRIPNGRAMIAGNFTIKQAEILAGLLKMGTLSTYFTIKIIK